MNDQIPTFNLQESYMDLGQANIWQSPNPKTLNFYNEIDLQLTNSPQNHTQHHPQEIVSNTQFNDQENFLANLQKLYYQIQTNEYILGLQQSQLQNLKRKQADLDKSIGKVNKKWKQKNQQETEIKRSLRLQKQRKSKLKNGFKLLKKQLSEINQEEVNIRNQRIQAQDSKNSIYAQYLKSQEQFRHILEQLHDLDGIETDVSELCQQNEYLKENIKRIINVLYGDDQEEVNQQRQSIREEIRDLNHKVASLESQQFNLIHQIDGIQNSSKAWQIEREKIKEKSEYGIKLAKKVQQLKTELAVKKAECAEIQSTYRQISIEENKLRKQMIIERQCRQEQKKYKDKKKMDGSFFGYTPRQYTPRQQARQEKKESGRGSSKIEETEKKELQRIIQRFENITKHY